jgi:hypothetical protein
VVGSAVWASIRPRLRDLDPVVWAEKREESRWQWVRTRWVLTTHVRTHQVKTYSIGLPAKANGYGIHSIPAPDG